MINITSVMVKPDFEELLNKFPEKFRDKLRIYTGEELYYVYRLCKHQGKKNNQGLYRSTDVLFMSLKTKFFKWLKGEVCKCQEERYNEDGKCLYKVCGHGIHPSSWDKLGVKFRQDFYKYLLECQQKSNKENLIKMTEQIKEQFNKKNRIA